MKNIPGYFPSHWPAEDGGPRREQFSELHPDYLLGDHLRVTSRTVMVATMVVFKSESEMYLLCHTGGESAVSWVEQVDSLSLEMIRRSPDLPGGLTWPGGIAVHENGSLYVAFGRYVHRLSSDLEITGVCELPRNRPYNSFVILPDGSLVTKDFGGSLPIREGISADCEVCVVDPESMSIRARLTVPEASIARLSADGNSVYCVGISRFWRLEWDPALGLLVLDENFSPLYRTVSGEGYGWDAVISDGSAWFLNNGEASDKYQGSLRGVGVASAPTAVIRVDLASGLVSRFEVSSLMGGVIANPPAVDPIRGIVVGYDSGNGVLTAWNYRENRLLWSRSLNHAAHPLVFRGSGYGVFSDYSTENGESLIVIDLESGSEMARCSVESPLQSVIFPSIGPQGELYYVSFTTLTRVFS
jgi:hypothetical protein